MASRRENYRLDFNDPHSYRDVKGVQRVRNFRPGPHYARRTPLFAPAAAAPAAAGVSTPIFFAIVAVIIVILSLVIGIPLAIIFGLAVPNAADGTVPLPGPTVPPVVPKTSGPAIIPTAVLPPRILLVRCPNDIKEGTDPGQAFAVIAWNQPTVLSQTAGQPRLVPNIQPNTQFSIGVREIQYTVTDNANNRGTCSFLVTVFDNEPPSIQCPMDMIVPTDLYSQSARVDWPPPTIVENTGIVAIQQMTDESGNHFHIGSHVVTIVVHDEANNENRCSFTIIVQDREAPRIACPNDLRAYTDDPTNGRAAVSWSAPVVQDNSMGALQPVTCVPPSGSPFVYGNTPVRCTATDAAGNQGSCMFSVNVRFNDTVAPVLNGCPPDISQDTAPDSDSTVVTWVAPTAMDNSLEAPIIRVNMQPNQLYSIGTYQVIYTATDVEGNSAQCMFMVQVVDPQNPDITCPADFSQDADAGQTDTTVTLPDATTSDNSMTPLTTSTDPSEPVVLSIGNHIVTYTVTDESGNSAMCNLTVTITDDEPPRIMCQSVYVVRANDGQSSNNVSLPDLSDVTDNSGGVVTITTSPGNNSVLDIGSHDVLYSATDPSGNTAMCNVTVTVVDFETPDLLCPANVSMSTDDGLPTARVSFAATVIDNAGIVTAISDYVSGSAFPLGVKLVTFTATDNAGNVATCTFTITIHDDENPDITCPADFSQDTDARQPDTTVTLPDATTNDNSITPLTTTTNPSGPLVLSIGNQTVTYTVTDESGNSAMCNLTVTITDVEPPSLTVPSDFSVPTNDGQSFATVSLPYPFNVMDNSGGVVTITTSPGNNSMLGIGSHDVMYDATDPSGNTFPFTVTVTVEDDEPPVLICPDDITRSTDQSQSFATVAFMPQNLTDNDGSTPRLMSNASGNSFNIGSTVITLTARDIAGNENMCSFTVIVEDNEDPVITCPADFSQDTDAGRPDTTVTLPDATTSDNSITPLATTTDPSEPLLLRTGNHTITYTVTDESGNSAMCNLTVMITDVEPPSLTVPFNFSVPTDDGQSFATVSLPYPFNVMDNSGGVVTITTSPGNNSMLGIGSHDVMYDATDPSGNTFPFTVTVTVADEELPVLICPDDITRSTDQSQSFATVAFMPQNLTDNDGSTPRLMSNASGSSFNIGSAVITLTARDRAGNENMCSFTVVIEDNEPPVLQCPSEVTEYSDEIVIPLAFSGVATWTINVTDNSGLPLMRNDSTHESGTVFNIPSTTVTYTAVDAYNNTNQCSFDVKIIGFWNTMCDASGRNLDLSELIGTGVRYHLFSPDYDIGNPYPSSSECVWRVSAPSGSYIHINFGTFATDSGKDIVYIGSGLDDTMANTSLASYGGKLAELADGTRHTKDRIFGDTIWLRFVSDSSFPQLERGFWLLFDFIAEPRNLYPASYSFCSEFGGFPCQDGSCIDISERCDGNSNDCPTNEDEMNCPQNCSTQLPDQRADFPTVEGVHHTDIVSVNYPGEYPPCNVRWDIDSNFVKSIRIVVMDLQINARDRLYVMNKDTGAQVTPDINSPISMHLTNGTRFALIFESGGGVGRGFWIRVWRYITMTTDFIDFPAYCELNLHSVQCGSGACISGVDRCDGNDGCQMFGNDELDCVPSGAIDCGDTAISLGDQGSVYHLTSVNYPADYYNRFRCQYIVTTTAATILVSFRDIEIGTTEDDLYIGNGGNVNISTAIIHVNGVFLPEDVESTGNQLWIEFVSNSIRNSRGFWIVLVAKGT